MSHQPSAMVLAPVAFDSLAGALTRQADSTRCRPVLRGLVSCAGDPSLDPCVSVSADGPVRRRGPRLEPLLLSPDERQVLERWTRRGTSAQALALRSRIMLACAWPDVPPIVGVARELGITADTVRPAAAGTHGNAAAMRNRESQSARSCFIVSALGCSPDGSPRASTYPHLRGERRPAQPGQRPSPVQAFTSEEPRPSLLRWGGCGWCVHVVGLLGGFGSCGGFGGGACPRWSVLSWWWCPGPSRWAVECGSNHTHPPNSDTRSQPAPTRTRTRTRKTTQTPGPAALPRPAPKRTTAWGPGPGRRPQAGATGAAGIHGSCCHGLIAS